MYVVIYSQVNTYPQDHDLQAINLNRIAEGKGWYIKKNFKEEVSDNSNITPRSGFKSLLDYIEKTQVDIVLVSEFSDIGYSVDDIMNNVELLHEKSIAFYINQFNFLTLENGKENPVTKILLQALSVGAQIENRQRHNRQREGIKLAKTKGVYAGRKQGAKTSSETLLKKYKNIGELIDSKELSIRSIAKTTNHSINTVRKVKQLKNEKTAL